MCSVRARGARRRAWRSCSTAGRRSAKPTRGMAFILSVWPPSSRTPGPCGRCSPRAQAAQNPMKVQPLHAAAAGRSFEAVKLLVDAGAPVNARQQEGWTPLHEVVRHGDVETTRYLLAHGADPRQQNDAGKSAIGLAAEGGNAEILKLLKARAP